MRLAPYALRAFEWANFFMDEIKSQFLKPDPGLLDYVIFWKYQDSRPDTSD